MKLKRTIKQLLGELPFTAEMYWALRYWGGLRQDGQALSESFSLRRTQRHLPGWIAALQAHLVPDATYVVHNSHSTLESGKLDTPLTTILPPGRRVLLFTTLRYWIEHGVLLGLALAGYGCHVTLAYLPFANWRKSMNRFDLRRQNLYAHQILEPAAKYIHPLSFFDLNLNERLYPYDLPDALLEQVEAVAVRDVQYTLQVEEVDRNDELYRLRLERNARAARLALDWMRANSPDVLLTPNGSILEMGAVYQVARYLGVPAVTYEFGEQRGRIWLAQDGEVMHQDTSAFWQAYREAPLSDAQWEQVQSLFASRQRADLWQNFSRRWQGQPGQGGQVVREQLGLDQRPIVLLAANVIGDSLTLGRQVFTDSMTEWLKRTVVDFARREDAQLVVRIHPGERYTKGPSVADIVRQALPQLPQHIHLVAAVDPVNTYDLVEIADLGLVYTTTVGMEMAMCGVPVLVIGQTHYRGKGFTLDPGSWDEVACIVAGVLADPRAYRLSRQQVERAWTYAYRFYFDYPQPFPWHLLHFWNELADWPLERVISMEGRKAFGNTFARLVGEPLGWGVTLKSGEGVL
jgi:hypothetical protein